jgi:RHS repeat-associated protein
VLLSRTVFSTPTSYTSGVFPSGRGGTVRDVELFDPSGNRLSKSRHYFYGMPNADYSLLVPWWHGKEFRIEAFDTDGTTILRVGESSWRQRIPSWCVNATPCQVNPSERAPTNNPFVVEIKSTLADGNLVSKVSGLRPSYDIDDPDGWAFDSYNNQTDVWRYDYGAGQSGALLKHTQVSYINHVTQVGGIYLFTLTDTTSDYSVNPAGQETLAASTQTRYDEYAQYPLMTYGTVTGWENPGSVRGNPTTVRRWLDTDNTWVETHARFDQLGNVRQSWDALGRLSETAYDDGFADNVVRHTYAFPTLSTSPIPDGSNAHGSNTAFESRTVYDYHSGLVQRATDINGRTTTFEYNDPLDRLKKVINPPGGGWTSFDYHDQAVGDLYIKTTTAFDAARNLESYSYFDGLGRSVRSFAPKGGGVWVVGDTRYDAAGRVVAVSKPYETTQAPSLTGGVNPANNWVTTKYDALGRVVKVKTADGSESTTAYVANTVTVTDAALKKRKSESDALGRLTQVTEDPGGANYITKYKYDVLGNLRGVDQGPPDQPQQQQHRYYAYDSLSRLVRSRIPEQDANPDLVLKDAQGNTINDPFTGNGQWSAKIDYYANGEVSSKTDARGIKIDYSYDNLNRLYRRTYIAMKTLPAGTHTPSPDVDYYYDGRGLAAVPDDSRGRLTKVSSSVSETRYTGFDEMGRIKSSEQVVGGETYQMPSYNYNLAGALVSQTYPSGRVVENIHDGGGRLSLVKGQSTGQAWKTYASDFDYSLTDTGATSRVKLGNGRWEGVTYNKRLQPTVVGLGATQDGTELLKLEYDYGTTNNNGNVRAQTITVPNINPAGQPSNAFTAVQTYGYDGLNRLTSAAEATGGQTAWRQTFDYDRFGNRSVVTTGQEATTSGMVGDNPAISAANNRITPRAGEYYDYDAAGNLVKDRAGNAYSFDGDGMQATFTYAGASQPAGQFFYDGDGRRVKKVFGGATTVFVYDAFGKLVAEYASNAQPAAEPTKYLTADPLGSPRVNTGQAGNVVARHDYEPFGEEIGAYGGRANHGEYRADTVRQKFIGYEHDENGLDYAQARYYASSAGRFTSVDPLASSASVASPQTFNRYSYALNNPHRYTDPTGMAAEGEVEMAFAFMGELADRAEAERQAKRDAEREAKNKQAQQQQPQQREPEPESEVVSAQGQDQDAATVFGDCGAIARGADARVGAADRIVGNHFTTAGGEQHTTHLYGDPGGNKTVGLYVPEGFTQLKYLGGSENQVMATNPKTGEVLIFAHVSAGVKSQRDLKKNYDSGKTNSVGSRYIGNIGGPGGGEAPGYRHSHITFYKSAAGRESIREQVYGKRGEKQGTGRITDFSGYGNMQSLVNRILSAK